MSKKNSRLDYVITITESFSDDHNESSLIYTWNGYQENSSKKSILKFIEDSGDEIKEQYLEFIHDLGEFVYQNRKIREYFQINEGPSLWWMSLLAEKNPWKSPSIMESIRILALEKIIINKSPTKLILKLDNRNVAKILQELCIKLDINYCWQPNKRFFIKNKFSYIICSSMISKFIGFAYICYYFFSRRELYKKTNKNINLNDNSIFFSSYFYNLDMQMAERGEYYSRQWGELPSYINKLGKDTYHLENYLKDPQIQSPKNAKKIIKLLNESEGKNMHTFLDSHLSLRLFWNLIIEYIKLVTKHINSKKIQKAFKVKNSQINLWPIIKDDWYSSLHGKNAAANLIWIKLFNKHLNEMPFQKMGFYLCENMGWERALVHAWKNNNHGSLIAVPHSTIRFWDLRYFSDCRINKYPLKYSIPVPDYYALNGEMAWNSFINNQYNENSLLKSEALRYQFLSDSLINNKDIYPNKSKEDSLNSKILILGDFTEHQTHLMLKELEDVIKRYQLSIDLTIKLHPVSNIDISNYPLLNLLKVSNPLEDIVKNFDIIFSSNTTSASLDCFLMGKKVIIFMDENNLNFSPLRGTRGVSFVSNSDDLYLELNSSKKYSDESKIDSFFWIDKEMPKWQKIILNLGD